jgi:hypothetical protein
MVGKTPCFGLHLVKNRRPQIVIDVEPGEGMGIAEYGALGYIAGKQLGNRIPYFRGIRPNRDELKALGAAMAATGAVALYHVEKITPETRVFQFDLAGLETISVGHKDIRRIFSEIPVDAVALGCPHCSPEELGQIGSLLVGKRVTKPLFVFAAKGVIERNPAPVAIIERSGARVFADTCMVVSPGLERFRAIMVNSGKALAYVPDMCGALARIGTLEDCIAAATS